MKAVYFQEHGGPEVLRYGDLADPQPGPGEVLLEVKAAALNHLDLFVRRGLPGIGLPHITGSDASGLIAALGEGTSPDLLGRRVLVDPSFYCGRCEFCVRGDFSMCRSFKILGEHVQGACCEKIVVPQENVVPIPDDFPFIDAAAVPLVFVTAWRMLVTRARVRPGETALILGAASGVGSACIQIAKVAGARVIACAGGEEKLRLCGDLGADVLVDYTRDDFLKRVREETGRRGVDICVDFVGKDTWSRSVQSLAKGGRLATCGATTGYEAVTDLRFVFFKQLEIIGSTMGSPAELRSALNLIFEGKMRAVVGNVVGLEDTAEGHRLLEGRRAVGKIVIRVAD